jgi:hypothetical protein
MKTTNQRKRNGSSDADEDFADVRGVDILVSLDQDNGGANA